MNRHEKIKALKALLAGRACVTSLQPICLEFWYSDNRKPGIYENEETGEVITEEQMRQKQAVKGDNILFLTICNYEQETANIHQS